MNEAKGGLQIMAAPADGWCDPDTGLCHIDTADEAATAEPSDDNVAGDAPEATQR